MTAAAHFPGVDLMDGHVPATNLNARRASILVGRRRRASEQRRVGPLVRLLVGKTPTPTPPAPPAPPTPTLAPPPHPHPRLPPRGGSMIMARNRRYLPETGHDHGAC